MQLPHYLLLAFNLGLTPAAPLKVEIPTLKTVANLSTSHVFKTGVHVQVLIQTLLKDARGITHCVASGNVTAASALQRCMLSQLCSTLHFPRLLHIKNGLTGSHYVTHSRLLCTARTRQNSHTTLAWPFWWGDLGLPHSTLGSPLELLSWLPAH